MTVKSLIFVAYYGFICVAISGGALNVAWLYIQADFGLPLSALGILLMFPAVVRLVLSFYAGRLIKWMGVGRFLLTGSLLAMAGMVGFMLTPSWGLLVIAGMVMGIGNSALINGLNIFVASNYASSRMNWLHASFGLGATVGPILITLVALDLDLSWRAGYGVMAVMMLALSGLFLSSLPRWRLPTAVPNSTVQPVGTKIMSPVIWLGIAVMFLSAGIETTTGQLSNSLFVDGRGYDARMVASWISLYWLSFTAGRFITGTVIDRINHNLFLRVSMFFAIVGASLIWLNPAPALNFVGLAIIGFAMAPIAPTVMGDTPRRVGVDSAPNVIGYQNTGAGFGIAFFPSLAGVLGEWIALEVIGLFLIVLTMTMFVLHELLNYQEKQVERSEWH